MPRNVDLALVIPFHNEERYLPAAIASLRTQGDAGVPVVFVNNGSTDASRTLVQQCAEVESGHWTCIEEPRIGKFFAMAAGADFCTRQLGAPHVAFLDADSYYGDTGWLQTSVRLLRHARANVGYVYSPYCYVGIQHMPTFAAAYQACTAAMRSISEVVGWFANSAGCVFSTTVLTRYFRTASVTTELGLRCSLLALSEGRRAWLNPVPVMTSARRIIASEENLRAWCFYARQFYLSKDINVTAKQSLSPPANLNDLPLKMVDRFFSRQAIKFAARNLIPLALFDRNDEFDQRLSVAFGFDIRARILGELGALRFRTDLVLTDEFETLLDAIERAPLSSDMATHIERMMQTFYEAETGNTPPPSDGARAL